MSFLLSLILLVLFTPDLSAQSIQVQANKSYMLFGEERLQLDDTYQEDWDGLTALPSSRGAHFIKDQTTKKTTTWQYGMEFSFFIKRSLENVNKKIEDYPVFRIREFAHANSGDEEDVLAASGHINLSIYSDTLLNYQEWSFAEGGVVHIQNAYSTNKKERRDGKLITFSNLRVINKHSYEEATGKEYTLPDKVVSGKLFTFSSNKPTEEEIAKDNTENSADMATREGAYEGTLKFKPGTVGYDVNQCIFLIKSTLGSFGQAKIGSLFNRPDVQKLLAQPSTARNNFEVAKLEYAYWKDAISEPGQSFENKAGGFMGIIFDPLMRAGGQMEGCYIVNNFINKDIPNIQDDIKQLKAFALYRLKLLENMYPKKK